MNIKTRPAREEDVECLADLCTLLGYPSTPEDVARRLSAILPRSGHAVFVAEIDGQPAGWVHIFVCPTLESDLFAEIGGLVVDTLRRGAGIGKTLMGRAEAWARQHDLTQVWLRSNIIRKEAHRFNQSLGYENLKTSYTFRKRL